jgi:hypothetical protein
MRRPLRRAALALAPLLVASGCATVFTGSSDHIAFDSNVPRVRLTLDGEYKGELPLTLEVFRKAEGGRFLARFERAGYQPQELELQREFNLVALLDVPIFIVGFPVDIMTGSIMKFEPTSYHVHMVADPAASAAPAEVMCRKDP